MYAYSRKSPQSDWAHAGLIWHLWAVLDNTDIDLEDGEYWKTSYENRMCMREQIFATHPKFVKMKVTKEKNNEPKQHDAGSSRRISGSRRRNAASSRRSARR